jgi:hypothetical protein
VVSPVVSPVVSLAAAAARRSSSPRDAPRSRYPSSPPTPTRHLSPRPPPFGQPRLRQRVRSSVASSLEPLPAVANTAGFAYAAGREPQLSIRQRAFHLKTDVEASFGVAPPRRAMAFMRSGSVKVRGALHHRRLPFIPSVI